MPHAAVSDAERYRAPGGWKRALIGFLLGVAAGVVVALLLPRDDGPHRVRTTLPDAIG